MARHDDASPLCDVLDTVANDGLKELLRDAVRDASQELIEEELTSALGAAKHERTETRTAQRDVYGRARHRHREAQEPGAPVRQRHAESTT